MINPEHLRDMRPSDRALEQCHLVTIPEPPFMRPMKKWCWDNHLSLIWAELIDTSDVDYNYDSISGFYFLDAKDATMFTLKFKR